MKHQTLRHRLAHAIGLIALLNPAHAQAPMPAEPPVATANRAVLLQLPFSDRQDFDDANRGFIATASNSPNADVYKFLQQAAPPTVNPSLWRQAQLNAIEGLFTVADGVYQVRGFSIANMTIVEGGTGLIVIDTLLTVDAARQAIELYYAHRPRKPVVAVVYTHSHGDHYGGVKGVTNEADVQAGKTRVIAPAGFMREAVSESVIAGNPMVRRAQYQFGIPLPRTDRGNVDAGLGKWDPGFNGGERSLIAPTDTIEMPVENRTIDGVAMVFQLAPASEAPAEMQIYLPQSHVLDMAENATHTLHNLLPLRGTEVRDAQGWSHYISDALERFGSDTQVLIAQHHWPVWGNARVRQRLEDQRDLYKYAHDQTVRMMDQGLAPAEVAEALTAPAGLEDDWSTRGYYGTLSHDAKAVYQKYLGWFDGNPAHLNPLPPVETAKKYVEYMGGAAAVIARARDDFKAGNYRWVAQVMDQVVYADPANSEARSLAAQAFEQLGYLAESATWRNAYLLGAQELRIGPPQSRRSPGVSPDTLHAMTLDLVFDHLGTRLNGSRAGTTKIVINWRFSDTKESAASTLSHGALTAVIGKDVGDADATVTMRRKVFEALILGQRVMADAIQRGDAAVTGNATRVTQLFGLFDDFDVAFPIVEPRR
jgi:alkyl sulfatase BDS1-like metallo-beta-lactamase superfamily hydrolase